MAVYVVSYDLRRPGRDYSRLYARLDDWKAVRGLESLWFIESSSTAVQIRDDLRGYIDGTDGLIVVEMSGAVAWYNLENQGHQFLQKLYGIGQPSRAG